MKWFSFFDREVIKEKEEAKKEDYLQFEKYDRATLKRLRRKKMARIRSRRSEVPAELVNKHVFVYNGYRYVMLLVKPEMVGHKFGEFVPTKCLGGGIHRRLRRRRRLLW